MPRSIHIHFVISFVCNRQALISVNGELLNKQLNRSCPQGRILSPFLWLILINGLLDINLPLAARIQAFADDTALSTISDFLNEIETTANSLLNVIQKWGLSVKLRFNPLKCEALIFTRKTKLQPITLIMNNQQLSVVTEFKYLVVWLDQRLNWHEHFDEAVPKTRRLIFAVNRCTRLKWRLSSEVLRVLWKQAFELILLYGCPIWSPALRINILVNKLRQVQFLIACKIIRSFKTVSFEFEASTVLANIVPVELSAKERITLFALKHIDFVITVLTC